VGVVRWWSVPGQFRPCRVGPGGVARFTWRSHSLASAPRPAHGTAAWRAGLIVQREGAGDELSRGVRRGRTSCSQGLRRRGGVGEVVLLTPYRILSVRLLCTYYVHTIVVLLCTYYTVPRYPTTQAPTTMPPRTRASRCITPTAQPRPHPRITLPSGLRLACEGGVTLAL